MKLLGLLFTFVNVIKNLLINFCVRFNNPNSQSFVYYLNECSRHYFLRSSNIKKNYFNSKINSEKLKSYKKTETVFIFGSGPSLNDINEDEWKKISKYDSIGFNNTILLEKINFTFHINRELAILHSDQIIDQINLINKNKFLEKTVFLMPRGLTSSYTNWIFSKNLWNKKKLFYLFNTNIVFKLPIGNLDTGLIHRIGTITDAISFAFFMGYKNIVLSGVDLVDRRYFFLKNKNETTNNVFGKPVKIDNHGKKVDDPHQTALNGIVNLICEYQNFFNKQRVNLLLFSEKSLLDGYLKKFKL